MSRRVTAKAFHLEKAFVALDPTMSAKSGYSFLKWDSELFGFKVARIAPQRLRVRNLGHILAELKSERFTLAYWASDPADMESQKAARQHGGYLADKKISYRMTFDKNSDFDFQSAGIVLREYVETHSTRELDHLSIQCGAYSRFRTDPRIPNDRFEHLYKVWLHKSITGELADAVFVSECESNIVGMITVCKKGDRGDIGLLAVNNNMQRKHVGVNLVKMAQRWFVSNHCRESRVITQSANTAGCGLYERCGYRPSTLEHVYHFWLR